MTGLLRLTFLSVVSLGIFSSCKKSTPDQARYIPKTAALVVSVNAGSLKDKLKQNEEALENILRNMSDDNTTLSKGKQEWEALKNAGIDLEESIYMWVQQDEANAISEIQANQPVSAVVAIIKDEDKFEAYVKSKVAGAVVKDEDDYKYVAKNDNNLVAWSEKVVVLLSRQNQFSGPMYDSLQGNFLPPQSPKTNIESKLAAKAKAIFSQKESASVSSIEEFAELTSQKADATIWVNSSQAIDNFSFQLPKATELAENNFTAATLQFNDGKIVVNSKSYAGKALKDILKKYAGPEVNLSLVQQYPSANVNGFMVFAFNPQFFTAIVKYMEVGGFVDGFLTRFMQQDYTLEKALGTLKGDIAVVVSDIAPANNAAQPGPGAGNAPRGKLIFTATLANAAEATKMADQLVAANMLEKVNGVYRPQGVPPTFGLTLSIANQRLIVASDSDILAAYATPGARTNTNLDLDNLKGRAAVGYLNIESILNAMTVSSTNNNNADSILPYARQTFRDVKAYANNFNGEFTEAHFELRFKNEKENSLGSLLQFLSHSSEMARKNRQPNMPSL